MWEGVVGGRRMSGCVGVCKDLEGVWKLAWECLGDVSEAVAMCWEVSGMWVMCQGCVEMWGWGWCGHCGGARCGEVWRKGAVVVGR
jgi:hypothetical protein